jgi:hypothetical protein
MGLDREAIASFNMILRDGLDPAVTVALLAALMPEAVVDTSLARIPGVKR